MFIKDDLRGEAVDGSQNPRIWQGKGQAGNPGQHRAGYEITARTVKFLGRRDNEGAPIGEPPPDSGENEKVLPF